eukprot:m.254594 g.254594  ORF g.254594 m.254594 type:complete len:60 (-) comp15494_c1_seq24:268-447(-)
MVCTVIQHNEETEQNDDAWLAALRQELQMGGSIFDWARTSCASRTEMVECCLEQLNITI